MKICMACKEEKPLDQFWHDRSKKHGYKARCKSCNRDAMRLYRKRRPDMDKKRYWKNHKSQQERHLVRKYGMTFKDYEQMILTQRGRCAICGSPEPENKRLAVDHDHRTDEVRGLLCDLCNVMLGSARDNPNTLELAAEYLRSSRPSRRSS